MDPANKPDFPTRDPRKTRPGRDAEEAAEHTRPGEESTGAPAYRLDEDDGAESAPDNDAEDDLGLHLGDLPGKPAAAHPSNPAQHSPHSGVHPDMATAAASTGFGAPWQAMAPEHAAAAPLPPAPEEGSDAAIMLRVREGDDSGFTFLIEKYRKQIVHFMYRMTGNQAVAEELAQEVFLRVYRSRESYRAEAKFTTWLYRIATNLGVNYARDHKHERAAQSVYLDQPDAETGSTPDVADSRMTAEQALLRDERLAGIRAAVLALPERQRKAVLMHKYQEMDYREIGAVLKLSESATKSLLFRAYQTLRERLKSYV